MNRNHWFVNLFVGYVKLTGLPVGWIFFKPRVIRQLKKLPKSCIIVSNHKSLLDFPLFLTAFPFRTIRFPMAEVLFNKGPLFAWFLRALGGIRVDRDAKDFSFISDSLEVLDKGGTLGIFPEGRLPVNGKPFPFTTSTAFIALHTDAPIVPVYIDGNYGITKRAGVVVGQPLQLAEMQKEGLTQPQQLEHLTGLLETVIYDLAEELK